MVTLTSNCDLQCLRWDCRRLPEGEASEYCSDTCQEMAASDSQSTLPFLLSSVYASSTELAPVPGKVLNVLRAGKESGVPRLSQDVFQTPPWQSSLFSLERVFCQWLFIGSHQIPEAVDFKWVQARSRTSGGVRRCVLQPSPSDDNNRWKLHQYTMPDVIGKAVYVMHYSID